MSNTLLTPSIIARESLMQLKNNLVLANLVDREFEKEYKGSPKPGSTISIRKPVRVKSTSGATAGVAPVTETSTSLAVVSQENICLDFLSTDLTLTIEQFSDRYIKPCMIEFAQKVDSATFDNILGVYNGAGTAGTAPSFSALVDLRQYMTELGVPAGRRNLVASPAHYSGFMKSMTTIANVQNPRSENQINGKIGPISGFDIYESATAGIFTNATGPIGNLAATTGTGSSAFSVSANVCAIPAGTRLTVASVYSVNPVTRVSTGQLQKWVVTSAVPAATTTIPISPVVNVGSVAASAAYQNINRLPTSGDAVTIIGSGSATYGQSLAFVREAISLVVLPLDLPGGAAKKAIASDDGLSVRVVETYDSTNDLNRWRFDILWGTALNYADLAAILIG